MKSSTVWEQPSSRNPAVVITLESAGVILVSRLISRGQQATIIDSSLARCQKRVDVDVDVRNDCVQPNRLLRLSTSSVLLLRPPLHV